MDLSLIIWASTGGKHIFWSGAALSYRLPACNCRALSSKIQENKRDTTSEQSEMSNMLMVVERNSCTSFSAVMLH